MFDGNTISATDTNGNVNIMLVLWGVNVAPMGPIDGDMHVLRPERDYPVWRSELPEGYITLHEVKIDFACSSREA